VAETALSPPVAGPAPLLVDAREAAALCGVSRAHWLALNSSGRVPMPVRLGRRVLWPVAELTAWIEAGCPARDRWTALRQSRTRGGA
jgi:predicted DNA-binding transcriptional regulator AlpA